MKKNLLSPAGLVTAMLFAAGFARGGFNDDWPYRAALTFSGYAGGETLTNFPVLVNLAGFPGFAYGQVADAAGGDLRFAGEDGAELNFEIDSWNPSGDTFVWVQVPRLTNNVAITAYWGNAAATLPAYATDGSTWSNGYVAVYHLAETSGTCGDSSPQANTLTLKGNTTLGSAGKVGLSPRLPDGNNDWLEAADHSSLEGMGRLTLEAWIYDEQNDTNPRAILSKRTSSSSQISFYLFKYTNRNISFSLGNSGGTAGLGGEFTGTATDANRWYHVAATYDKDLASNRMKVFLDGVYKSARNEASGNVTATTSALRLGILNADYGNAWKGKLDEVRVANVARSADWLAATHKTIADNAGFAAYGAMETTDSTTPVFAADPAISLSESGDAFVFSAELASGEADLFAVFGPEEPFAYTNLLALGVGPGVVVSNTLSGLPADRMLNFGVLATNANGHAILRTSSTPFMSGEVAIVGTSDAFEEGFVHGAFTLTRPATATNLPLTVAYSASGTAVGGVNHVALSGTATFPVGAASVAIDVTPLLDPANANDTTLTLTIEPGLYFIGEDGEASITVQNWDPPAGYNTWIAPAAGNASVAANWSHGVPTSGDAILLGAFSTADMTWDAGVNGLPNIVASWTQTNYYTGTVTFNTTYPAAATVFTNFTVTGNAQILGGKWTHQPNTTVQSNRLCVAVGGDFTLGSGTAIALLGKGFEYGKFHAGSAIATHAASPYGSHSQIYGNVYEPTELGSGGDSANSAKSYGGGAVYLAVGGSASVDGTIDVRSSSQKTSGNNPEKGCGAGGSVYLSATSISGAGSVNASCYDVAETSYSYNGSGGRVALIATSGTVSLPLANLKANGGAAGNSAGGGTIFLKNAADANGTLLVGNDKGNSWSYAVRHPKKTSCTAVRQGESWAFDRILLRDQGILSIPASATLNLAGGWQSVSNLTSTSDPMAGILYLGGTLNVPAAAEHQIAGKWIFQADVPYTFDGDVRISNYAAFGNLLLAQSYPTNAPACDITVNGDLAVTSSGFIYGPGRGIRSGTSAISYHGGLYSGAASTLAYDSILNPAYPGNNGQNGDAGNTNPGGGTVQVTVTGTLTHDGVATVAPVTKNTSWNRGSGGTLNITAAYLDGSGSMTASGTGGSGTYYSGAGGRISVRLTGPGATFNEFGTDDINANGGTHSAGTAGLMASAGTVYLQTGAQAEGAGCGRRGAGEGAGCC